MVGIAAGFSIASIFNALCLFIALHYFLSEDGKTGLLKEFDLTIFKQVAKITICALAGGLAAYGALYAAEPFINTRTVLGLLAQAAAAGLLGSAIYFMAAVALDLSQAKKFVEKYGSK